MPKRVYRFTELPRECPACAYKFSEILYRKLYPRKYRVKAMLVFACGLLLSLVLFPLVGFVGLLPLFFLGVWAMSFHKSVRVYCRQCGWSQKYVVQNRG